MSSTNKTSKLNLTQFLPSDTPSWLNDYNNDMQKIDAELASIAGGKGILYARAEISGTEILITFDDEPATENYVFSFIAPEDYEPAHMFKVNNVELPIKGANGQPLEPNAWSTGVPVVLIKNEGMLFSVNTSIIKAVNSDVKQFNIRNTYFSNTATWPEGAGEGDILAVYI